MIKETIHRLNSELPATVKLVAVSKFHPFEAIEEAYAAGQRLFAESRPQELLAKVKRLEEIRAERGEPDYMSDIEWHFIGHLQTNKLKMVLPYVSMVQSVDSVRLLEAIDRWGAVNGKVINVLLECFISSDETKQGLSEQELTDIISGETVYANVRICGLMGMATFTDSVCTEIKRQNIATFNDSAYKNATFRRSSSVSLRSTASPRGKRFGCAASFQTARQTGI